MKETSREIEEANQQLSILKNLVTNLENQPPHFDKGQIVFKINDLK